MKPHHSVSLLDVTTQEDVGLTDAHHHLPRFFVEDGSKDHAQYIDIYTNRVHNNNLQLTIYDLTIYPNVSMANFILFITSSLPKKAESSYMSGPCPVPTSATRQAFQGLMPVSSVQGSMMAF